MNFIDAFIIASYLFLPAAIATLAPQIAAKYKVWEFLNIPVDGGLKLGGKRVLGANKTVRGFIVGSLAGVLVGLFQFLLAQNADLSTLYRIDYSNLSTSLYSGLLLGFGSIFGDSVKSFFKRQLEIPPGEKWFPFDQVDQIIGAYFILTLFFLHPGIEYFIAGIVFYLVIHLISTNIGYNVGIKSQRI